MARKLALLADRFNTLWFEDGCVHMLNRRKYPLAVEYVTCKDLESVAKAIEDMTIQGAPPLAYAAGLGLAMHARVHEDEPEAQFFAALEQGCDRLRHTRPTGWDLDYILTGCMRVAHETFAKNGDVSEALRAFVYEKIAEGNRIARDTGRYAADLIADGARIQTICFAGAALAYTLYFAAEDGKDIQLFASETRPYLQGARLTAKSCVEMGIPVTVVTDNMPAYLMQSGKTNMFISTADKITMDGYIANKIGTSRDTVAWWINNNSLPKRNKNKTALMKRMAELFGCEVSQLNTYVLPPKSEPRVFSACLKRRTGLPQKERLRQCGGTRLKNRFIRGQKAF